MIRVGIYIHKKYYSCHSSMTFHNTKVLIGTWVEGLNVNGSTKFQSDGFLVPSTSGLGCLSSNAIRFIRIALFMEPMWLIGSTFHHLTAPKKEGTKRGISEFNAGFENTDEGGFFFLNAANCFLSPIYYSLHLHQHGRFHSDS